MNNPFVSRLRKLAPMQLVGLGLIAVGVVLFFVTLIVLAVGHLVSSPAAVPTGTPYQAVVEITANGFMPTTLQVKPNTEVTWIDEDSSPHLVAADPYPTHRSLPSLVAPRALGKKETYSFLFTKRATIHYHDDLNPLLAGSIIVK